MLGISTSLAAFIASATLLTIAPGLDTALVLRTAAGAGSRPAALTGLGIAAGCFAWAVLVAVGLGALLAASERAYAVMRWVGAGYLVWMGIKMLRQPRHEFLSDLHALDRRRRAFSSGLLTNLLNPKVGVFYVSFLPQFVPQGVPVGPYILLLGAIHAGIGLLWFACLIAATRPIARFLRKPAVVRGCDRLTGGLFISFGVGLALQSRRA